MYEPVAMAGGRAGLGAARPPPVLDRDGRGLAAPTNRVTADSFRALMAKLGTKTAAERAVPVPALPIPDIVPEPSGPPPVAAASGAEHAAPSAPERRQPSDVHDEALAS